MATLWHIAKVALSCIGLCDKQANALQKPPIFVLSFPQLHYLCDCSDPEWLCLWHCSVGLSKNAKAVWCRLILAQGNINMAGCLGNPPWLWYFHKERIRKGNMGGLCLPVDNSSMLAHSDQKSYSMSSLSDLPVDLAKASVKLINTRTGFRRIQNHIFLARLMIDI